jgi:hypothetical protein
MSEDKKVAAETKLSEEEKLLEEKTAGFIVISWPLGWDVLAQGLIELIV